MSHTIVRISKGIVLLFSDFNTFIYKVITGWFNWLPASLYLRILYRCLLGKKLHLKNPKTFTEKLQWLKLNYHNPLMKPWVEKDMAKELAASIIGEDHIIPTLGIWDNLDDVDLSKLPEKFVLKATNGGGGTSVYICHNKNLYDAEAARKVLSFTSRNNVYDIFKEWPYKNTRSRIIAEEYMDEGDGQLTDYKFYCFNGTPYYLLIASDRFSLHNFTYFDMDFNLLPITCKVGSPSLKKIVKPKGFNQMKEFAMKLSQGFPHVRVDLYFCYGNVYFGELTFFDASGFDDMNSEYWDQKFGEYLILPKKMD